MPGGKVIETQAPVQIPTAQNETGQNFDLTPADMNVLLKVNEAVRKMQETAGTYLGNVLIQRYGFPEGKTYGFNIDFEKQTFMAVEVPTPEVSNEQTEPAPARPGNRASRRAKQAK